MELGNNKSNLRKPVREGFSARKMREKKGIKKAFKLKIMVALIAIHGWGYQTFLLSLDYFSYRTMTRLDYETRDVIGMPAIWFCYAGHIPYQVLGTRFPPVFELGMKNFKSRCKSNDIPNDWLIRNLTGYEFELREEMKMCHIMDAIKAFPYANVEVEIKSVMKYENSSADFAPKIEGNVTNEKDLKADANPLESIGPLTRCVAYFSNLFIAPNGKSTTIPVHRMHKSGEVLYDLKKSALPPCFDFQISVSYGNNLPTLHQFQSVAMTGHYMILFSSINVESMEPPYDTNCRKYSSEIGEEISQSNCVSNCILKSLDERRKKNPDHVYVNEDSSFNYSAICHNRDAESIEADNCYLIAPQQMYAFWAGNDRKTTKQSVTFVDATDIENECQNQCPRDCFDVTYDFMIKEKKRGSDGVREVPVQVKHDYKHDIVIRHFAEFPLMTFIASIGGLAGLWLGFSIMTLYENLMLYGNYLRMQYEIMKKRKNIFKEGYKYAITKSAFKRQRENRTYENGNYDNRRRNRFLSELANDHQKKT